MFVYDNEKLKEELLHAVDDYHHSAAKLQKLAVQALFTVVADQQRQSQPVQPAVSAAPERNTGGRLLFDQKQTAEYLGVATRTLEKWRVTGEGPPYVKMGRILYEKKDLDAFVADHKFRHTSDWTARTNRRG